MITISNAFSISMLPLSESTTVWFRRTTPTDIAAELQSEPWQSAVGHADVAAIFSGMLGLDIPVNRVNVQLAPGDALIVGQYSGPRLPEGTTILPVGATIQWWTVDLPTPDDLGLGDDTGLLVGFGATPDHRPTDPGIDTSQIRAHLSATSPGHWVADHEWEDGVIRVSITGVGRATSADAAFITNARAEMEAVLRDNDRLRKLLFR